MPWLYLLGPYCRVPRPGQARSCARAIPPHAARSAGARSRGRRRQWRRAASTAGHRAALLAAGCLVRLGVRIGVGVGAGLRVRVRVGAGSGLPPLHGSVLHAPRPSKPSALPQRTCTQGIGPEAQRHRGAAARRQVVRRQAAAGGGVAGGGVAGGGAAHVVGSDVEARRRRARRLLRTSCRHDGYLQELYRRRATEERELASYSATRRAARPQDTAERCEIAPLGAVAVDDELHLVAVPREVEEDERHSVLPPCCQASLHDGGGGVRALTGCHTAVGCDEHRDGCIVGGRT